MSKKILIVDDEAELVELFSDILAAAGFNIYKAYNGEEAMQYVNGSRPDMILLDVRMPKTDGFEFLQKLRESDELQNIKVIMLSNMQGQEYLDKATDLGADDYWYKMNTHLVDLVDKVKKLLA